MTIKIVLAGPRGNMGQEAIKMIANYDAFSLVACIDRMNDGKSVNELFPEFNHLNAKIYSDANVCFNEVKPDVYVDLTNPQVGYNYTKLALENNIHAVVGTSGFSEDEITTLSSIAETNKIGCIIAPNFALGAVLMMLFSKMAAQYFADVEIIEKHHDRKLDAPSGTGVKTAELIKEVRTSKRQGHPEEVELISGARGAEYDGIRIHSMRLPGLVAHQEVIFGSNSQLLTIKHDSFHRESFMDGLKLAIEEVTKLEKLVYGLENIMELKTL